MNHCLLLGCLISFGLSAGAQTINLRGKVTNLAGVPIPNAIVALVHQGLMDTTETDGTYSFSKITAIGLPLLSPQIERISLNKSVLEFNLTRPSMVKVEIFNAKGNLLKRGFFEDAIAGAYRLSITEYCQTANLLIIHVVVGNREMALTYLPLHNGKCTVNFSNENLIPVGGKLAKLESTIDTLQITAPGYLAHAAAISSYDTMVNITLDSIPKLSGNWRLERATCTSERSDSCRVGLQICPSFYCFSDNRLTKYESSYQVACTAMGGCDTTLYCYDTLANNFDAVNDTLYRCWGDDIVITYKIDTLLFRRERVDSPGSSSTYYFVKETRPVPHCSRECVNSHR